jgi:transposase
MNATTYRLWVGIDWATAAHQVCVLDAERRVVLERVYAHSGPGLAALVDDLARLESGAPEQVAVAIEVPRGPVVETVLERRHHVYAINPKQLDRFRDRFTVAGAKDDRRDAFVLAHSLSTDRDCFRRVEVDAPTIIQLRELSRIEEDLREEHNRLTNRLREQLHRYYPQLLDLCPSADEPWLWALWELAPTPARGAKLRIDRVGRLLREERIRRLNAAAVCASLREPALVVAPGTPEAAVAHIALLLPRLRLVRDERQQCARQIEALLEGLEVEGEPGQRNEHRDVCILRSLPGVGRTVAATMLAEAAQALAARDYHALRALSGVAPITRQSGKSALVIMRRGCNGRLRNAVYHWARVCVMLDGHWRARYTALRARGQTHGRALRAVADRLLARLVAMLRDRTLYDAARARARPRPNRPSWAISPSLVTNHP